MLLLLHLFLLLSLLLLLHLAASVAGQHEPPREGLVKQRSPIHRRTVHWTCGKAQQQLQRAHALPPTGISPPPPSGISPSSPPLGISQQLQPPTGISPRDPAGIFPSAPSGISSSAPPSGISPAGIFSPAAASVLLKHPANLKIKWKEKEKVRQWRFVCARRVGQPTQRAANYTARSNIEPAQKFSHANAQSAPTKRRSPRRLRRRPPHTEHGLGVLLTHSHSGLTLFSMGLRTSIIGAG